MTRLHYLGADELQGEPDHIRQILGLDNVDALRAIANSKGALRAVLGFIEWIGTSSLDVRLRELAILEVGYTTTTAYEWAHHVLLGRDRGLSSDDIHAIGEEFCGRQTHLGTTEVVVLRAAREMTLDLAVSDETFAALEAGLSAEEIVDLVAIVSFYNGVVRSIGALAIPLETDLERVLAEFPLPDRPEGQDGVDGCDEDLRS
jgi:alkylhydroperoxidase family enzyme